MLNYNDVQQLRAKGTSNYDILKMMSRTVPSAAKAISDIDADTATPTETREGLIGRMIDSGVPRSGPSGLPYVNSLGISMAQRKSDTLDEQYQQEEPGFFERIGNRMGGNFEKAGMATEKYRAGEQGFTDSFLQRLAYISRGVAAPVTETIDTVVGGAMEMTGLDQAVGGAVEGLANSKVGQQVAPVIEKGKELYQMAPEPYRNTFEAVAGGVMEGAEIYGAGKVLQAGKQGIQKGAAALAKKTAKDSSDDVVQKLVQPKVTAKVVKETTAKNPELVQKGGLLKSKKTLLPSAEEKALADTARTIPGFGQTDDILTNAQVVHSNLRAESQALRSSLASNNAALPHQEVIASVERRVMEAAADFGDQPGVFKSVIEMARKSAAKNPGDLVGAWDGRILFDDDIISRFGTKVFEKGSARAVAIRAARQAWNDAIEEAAQRAGRSFAPQISRISDHYAILENLASKTGTDTLRAKAANFLRTPIGRYAGYTAVGGAAYGVGQSL